MSKARECDLCGAIVKMAPGLISVDLRILDKINEGAEGVTAWLDIELCSDCGTKLLAVISPALDGIEQIRALRPEGEKT